jgi:hypothetical protein
MPYQSTAIALIFIVHLDLNVALELLLAGIKQRMFVPA